MEIADGYIEVKNPLTIVSGQHRVWSDCCGFTRPVPKFLRCSWNHYLTNSSCINLHLFVEKETNGKSGPIKAPTEPLEVPTGFVLKDNIDNYILENGQYVYLIGINNNTVYGWMLITNWIGYGKGNVADLGYRITAIAIKEEIKPRFKTDKPYPYGY